MTQPASRRPARTPVALLLIVVLSGAGLILAGRHWLAPPSPTVREHVTISVLRNEKLAFLVARRGVTQIVIEHEQSSWLGEWHGVLWATVHFHYGVDLQTLTDADMRRDGDVLVVRLPEPQLLDFGVVPGSMGLLTKSTAAAKIEDLMHNGHRRVLERRLKEEALSFARANDLMPTRAQLVAQLNDALAVLGGDAGTRLRFE